MRFSYFLCRVPIYHSYKLLLFNLNEFLITDTKLKLIAKVALMGDNSNLKTGNNSDSYWVSQSILCQSETCSALCFSLLNRLNSVLLRFCTNYLTKVITVPSIPYRLPCHQFPESLFAMATFY